MVLPNSTEQDLRFRVTKKVPKEGVPGGKNADTRHRITEVKGSYAAFHP